MAGRIRTIKPELLEDERTGGLSSDAFRLFIGLILIADDYGNFRAHPRVLAGHVFMYQPSIDVDPLLSELVAANLVALYQDSGQRYGHLLGWEKHQRVDKPGKPRVPEYGSEKRCDSAIVAFDSRESRESAATDLRPTTTTNDQIKPENSSRDVSAVWDSYLDAWRKLHPSSGRPPVLNKTRRGQIGGRLKDGFTVEDLQRAIAGIFADPWRLSNPGTLGPDKVFRLGNIERYVNESEGTTSPKPRSKDFDMEDDWR